MEEKLTFELRPPASPDALLSQHEPSLWLFLGGGLLLIVLIAGIVFWLLRRKPVADPSAIRREALRAADRALAEAKPTGIRDAATLASLVLRRYLATVAGDPALFETHEEFIARRDSLARLQEAARTSVAEGFARLAALKYDRQPPTGDPAVVIDDARALLTTLDRALRA
ncbi:MAG TPA: hypothetical protein VIM57_10790 [Luteolibacter sp.]